MNQYVPCPRRKNGSKVHINICKEVCPMKHYVKCKLNEGAYWEIEKRWRELPNED